MTIAIILPLVEPLVRLLIIPTSPDSSFEIVRRSSLVAFCELTPESTTIVDFSLVLYRKEINQ
jgi:hypothetical protein